ncbi:MAG: CTP synthase [Spirochaetales bacterium]|nr:CTP synthase [Spirochaetales bacterium]
MSKYIFVSGGVCSSLGKGIAAATIGNLLEGSGLTVNSVKIDPYINVDAGTMNPIQHGEVYVTDDGAETDLDLGNYARFTNSDLSRDNSITTGQVYQEVIRKEREGRFLGRTVQVIPHITDEIKQRIQRIGEREDLDVTIVEIGGTVGDIESVPFIEAARQFIHDFGKPHVLYIHLTLVPTVSMGELKTKPTQHSVKELLEIGIQPDILLCRCEVPLNESLKHKISLFTNVEEEAVISANNVANTIYEIPMSFEKQGLDTIIMKKLDLKPKTHNKAIREWEKMINGYIKADSLIKIGIVGKYVELHDSYKSVFEALVHGGIANKVRVEIIKIDSEKLETGNTEALDEIDGILVPGGFGQRGIEGMICAVQYARTREKPYFGICLGMQMMVIEYARNVAGLNGAHSTECEPNSPHPVISLLEEQENVKTMGGTMRLGANDSKLTKGTKIFEIYGKEKISERHRHRYEFANHYREPLIAAGLTISGTTMDGELVESVEWQNHPWGVGVQFHPEFKSRPDAPHPIFYRFIEECKKNAKKK